MEETEITTIQITKKTRNELKKLGNMSDTYNSVIVRLIKFFKENKK